MANESANRRPDASDDPYLWLEEVTGERALEWVRARNEISKRELERDPAFEPLRSEILEILDSDARIPMARKHGSYYYNFWRDRRNPRGLWRRTTPAEYGKLQPAWEILLDLDVLGEREGESWVWGGAQLLRPDFRFAMIALSRGGADAVVYREFDIEARQFVTDGFALPEAKGAVSWIDRDHLFVATDFGPGSLTDSGYPRIAKLWTRGTQLERAETVYEGLPSDLTIEVFHDDSPGFERDFLVRVLSFYNDERFLRREGGELVRIPVPNSAQKRVFHEHLTIELRESWEVDGRTFPGGSLLLAPFDDFLSGDRQIRVVFTPTEHTSLSGYGFTKDYLFVNVLEDVKSRIYFAELGGRQRLEPLRGAHELSTVEIWAVDAEESNEYFMVTTDYLTPTTLSIGDMGGEPKTVKTLPQFFDADRFSISQQFATSDDGTRVPYFMVAPRGLEMNGEHPTLLYGYGGFEVSMRPIYEPVVGRAWLEAGGVYVVANIRGGGEYGPRWHQAALKANRHRAYEDFAAVARDLVSRKVTSARRLGIQGGSNGGLLVGNMVTGYPDLLRGAVCQVPLLDMKRFSHLLAGASWMAEYGNPDLPEEWEFVRTISPYHNIRPDASYPDVLLTTSTRDDRVHPGHARKMTARMEEYGHRVLYYENIEGGHGGAATNEQSAYMQALAYIFLRQRLF